MFEVWTRPEHVRNGWGWTAAVGFAALGVAFWSAVPSRSSTVAGSE